MAVEEEYDRFASFIAAQSYVRNDYYIESLISSKQVKSVSVPRTLREIIGEIGRGLPVRFWKKDLVPNALVRELVTLRDEKIGTVSYDLLELNFEAIGIFLPEIKDRKVISNWREAQQNDCLRSYFAERDIFGISEGKREDLVYEYNDDYYDFLRTYPLKERVIMYRNYLVRNSISVPVRKNSFDDPRYFAQVAEKQMGEYEEILSNIDLEDRGRFVFVGDGLGTGSMLSIKNNWNYVSSEPKGIGLMAIKLGIISYKDIHPSDYTPEDVLVLLNVEEYLNGEEKEYYKSRYKKIVVYNECGSSDMGDGKELSNRLFSRGVNYFQIPRLRQYANVKGYLDARSPVEPQDDKSFFYAVQNNIPIQDKGFRISYDNVEGAFNIRSRAYPSNLKMARRGDIKIVDGIKFEYQRLGQVVTTPSQAFKYYPYDPGSSSVLIRGKYRVEQEYIVSVLKRPRQIRMMEDENGVVVPIYYLFSRKVGEVYEAIFTRENVGVVGIAKGADYQIS